MGFKPPWDPGRLTQNPAESLPYQVGEVLCFIIAPALLISGIAMCIMAPHEKKERRAAIQVATPPRKKTTVYSATRLLVSRIIGAALAIFLLALPFITGGVDGWRLFLGMFVIFPFPLITLPCLAMALYLAFHKTPRGIDIPAIIACVILLLALPFGIVIAFFLPFLDYIENLGRSCLSSRRQPPRNRCGLSRRTGRFAF